MADKDFKVKNGLIVKDSATIGIDLTVAGSASITGNAAVTGTVTSTFTGNLTGNVTGTTSSIANHSTTDLAEGNKLYYTTVRGDSDTRALIDSAYVTLKTPEYVRLTPVQTLTNKTLVDPKIDSTNVYGIQYGGLSINVDGQLGDSNQSVLNFTSDSAGREAVLSLGVSGQHSAAMGVIGTSASGTLVLGMENTNTGLHIRNNVGKAPYDLDGGTSLVEMTAAGVLDVKNETEAASKTTAALVIRGGLGVDKNIRGQDILAQGNVQALTGELKGTLSAASLGTRTTADLPEGSNLYYTTARVDSYINASILTTDVSEGTNLYYTKARADSDAQAAITINDGGGDGSLVINNTTGVITYTGPSAAEVRAHFSGGTGVTFNASSGAISIGQAVAATDSVNFNSMNIAGNMVVSGNLTVLGTQDVQSQSELSVTNPFIKVADSNSADTVDIGVVGRYGEDSGGTTVIKRTGFIRDATNGEWYVFDGLKQQGIDSGTPTDTTININGPGFNLPTWNFGKLRGSYLGFDSDFAAFSSNYTVQDSSFTAVNAGRYAVNTTDGVVTVTLPATPITGHYVRLIDVANFTTNSVVLNRNGNTIEGFSDNFELDLGQSIIELIYINNNWQLYSSIGQRGPAGPKGDSADVATFSTQAQAISFAVALG